MREAVEIDVTLSVSQVADDWWYAQVEPDRPRWTNHPRHGVGMSFGSCYNATSPAAALVCLLAYVTRTADDWALESALPEVATPW